MFRRPVEISNVEVNLQMSNRAWLSWEHGDARYHVWTHDLGQTFEKIVYKNPLLDVQPFRDGWYSTRRLNIDSSPNRRMFNAAHKFAMENGLFGNAVEKEKNIKEEIARQHYETEVLMIKHRYAEEMYSTLENIGALSLSSKDHLSVRVEAETYAKIMVEKIDAEIQAIPRNVSY